MRAPNAAVHRPLDAAPRRRRAGRQRPRPACSGSRAPPSPLARPAWLPAVWHGATTIRRRAAPAVGCGQAHAAAGRARAAGAPPTLLHLFLSHCFAHTHTLEHMPYNPRLLESNQPATRRSHPHWGPSAPHSLPRFVCTFSPLAAAGPPRFLVLYGAQPQIRVMP